MRCTVMPEILRQELGRSAKVSTKDGSVYSYVELSAIEGQLHIRAQDEHVGFVSRVGVAVEEVGAVLVDCARLVSVLGARPDGTPISLRSDGAFLQFRQGEFKAKLPVMRHGSLPELDFSVPFDIDVTFTPDMLHGLLRCRYSMDTDEQSMFAGMLLDFAQAGVLRVAAFTRALLQVAHFDFQGVSPCRFVLSPRCLPILEALPKEPFRFAFSATRSKVYIFAKTFAAIIACAQDRYPVNYEQVLGLYRWREGVYPVPLLSSSGDIASELQRTPLVFDKAEVANALASVVVVLDREDQIVGMHIRERLADGRTVVEFTANNTMNKAQASEKVLASGAVESAISLGLNHAGVRGALRHLDGESFTLHIGRKEDAIVFTEKDHPNIVALSTLMRL